MDHRIEERIAALEAEIVSLKEQLAAEGTSSAPMSDRRGMMKLLAAGAAGALTGAAAFSAHPASAADNFGINQGQNNVGTATTGITTSNTTALRVDGSPYGIEVDGGAANAKFSGSGKSPIGTDGVIGELYVDEVGNWWAAATTATPAVWRKLAGPATAGQFHLLAVPVRVYDTRPGLTPVDIGPKTPVPGSETRSVTTTLNTSGVPSTANAVLINLTITRPLQTGFATVWPSGAWPGTSNINFTAGQTIATTTVVGCGPQATFLFLSNTATDFVIDVVGYYQ